MEIVLTSNQSAELWSRFEGRFGMSFQKRKKSRFWIMQRL